jgi:hypothetical protein
MENAVRLIPSSSDRSTPSEATVAPTRTAGSSHARRPAPKAVASGASDPASAGAPAPASAATATAAYTASVMPSAIGMARGIVLQGTP